MSDEQKIRIGRPPLSAEHKTAREIAAREYKKKWVAANKEKNKANQKRHIDKVIGSKKFVCALCQRAFPSDQALKYHSLVSKAHKAN